MSHIILLGYFGCLTLGCETRVEIFRDFVNYYFRILFQKSIVHNKKYSKIVGQWLLQRFFYGFYFHGLFSGKFVTEVNIPFKYFITRRVLMADILPKIWLCHYTTPVTIQLTINHIELIHNYDDQPTEKK